MKIQELLNLYKSNCNTIENGVAALGNAQVAIVSKIYDLTEQTKASVLLTLEQTNLLTEVDAIRDLSDDDFLLLQDLVMESDEASRWHNSNVDVIVDVYSTWHPCDVCSGAYTFDEPCVFH